MSKNWITQGQYDLLSAELADRVNVQRPRIVALIEAARAEGDLSENGGYQAAREEQSMNETRINELQQRLKESEVGETPADDGIVKPGMVIVAEISGEREEFLLGTRDAGENLDIRIYPPSAPLGKAIIGAKAGESVTYKTPSGKGLEVRIVSVHPYQG